MTWHKNVKTKKQAVDNMREIMAIPDDLILQWLEEAYQKGKKEETRND
jgi:hypothetical protein